MVFTIKLTKIQRETLYTVNHLGLFDVDSVNPSFHFVDKLLGRWKSSMRYCFIIHVHFFSASQTLRGEITCPISKTICSKNV